MGCVRIEPNAGNRMIVNASAPGRICLFGDIKIILDSP